MYSTHEAHVKYLCGCAVPVRQICSTREAHQNYLVRHTRNTREGNFIRFPFIKSHSLVLWVCLTGFAHPHGYFGCASQVLQVCLTGTAHPREYCTPSRVLHIQGDIVKLTFPNYNSDIEILLSVTESELREVL